VDDDDDDDDDEPNVSESSNTGLSRSQPRGLNGSDADVFDDDASNAK